MNGFRLLAVLAGICFSNPAFASDKAAFIPAAFGPKTQSVIDKIKFPESDKNVSVNVYCEAQVSIRGEVKLKFCFTAGRNVDRDDFSFAVSRAFHRVRISPAFVGGKRVLSTIQFMVKFVKVGVEEQINLYPNFDLNREYGSDYIAPQYYWERDRTDRCDNKANIALSLVVNEDGKPENIEILNKGLSEFCSSYFVSIIERRKYIPAFYDGRPVRSRHIDYLNIGRADSRFSLGIYRHILYIQSRDNTR